MAIGNTRAATVPMLHTCFPENRSTTLPENPHMTSARIFAECRISSTRQSYYLPSAKKHALGEQLVLGVLSLCRVPARWHSAKTHFAECQSVDTRQRAPRAQHPPADDPQTTVTVGDAFVCRVPTRGHSANRSLPSAPQSTLGKLCHVPRTRRCHKRSHFSTAVTVIVCRVPVR